MDCLSCNGTYIAWDSRILEQLNDGVRARFPAVLTHKYACDRSVVSLLRSRTLGNSPTALQHNIHELHSDAWLRAQLSYLSDCERHKLGRQSMGQPAAVYLEAPTFRHVPCAKWFLACYVRDVCSRLPELKAAATSIFGSILKMDSTKKICRKLQGAAAATASWATSVGNESGEVVISVLTTSEDLASLQPLADGLMLRYEQAARDPPSVLYVDRDCCNASGPAKPGLLFRKWTALAVRLDIWHYMRRMACGCSSESHPLYGTFMSSLSGCIFEWDAADYSLLVEAKKSELAKIGVRNPTDEAAKKAITRDELAKHCRRRTRGTEQTTQLVEAMILSLMDATDMLGVRLFKDEISSIWEEQKRHVACLQDPPGVSLYTKCGTVQKGEVVLPVFRCARGSTSLENFHLHLARFIPGTSASAVNFQAYLLEGLARWNDARKTEAIDASPEPLRTFDMRLRQLVNEKSLAIHGKKVLSQSQPPAPYTGELLGVEYLLAQSGTALPTDSDDIDNAIDEGFDDFDDSVESLPVDDAVDNTNADPVPAVIPDDTENASDSSDVSLFVTYLLLTTHYYYNFSSKANIIIIILIIIIIIIIIIK